MADKDGDICMDATSLLAMLMLLTKPSVMFTTLYWTIYKPDQKCAVSILFSNIFNENIPFHLLKVFNNI